jgi:hypothetical protein
VSKAKRKKPSKILKGGIVMAEMPQDKETLRKFAEINRRYGEAVEKKRQERLRREAEAWEKAPWWMRFRAAA